MGLYLFTENFFWKARVKTFVKMLAGRALRGPQAVQQSLFLGLQELDEKFAINQRQFDHVKTVGVLADLKVLRWAIEQKRHQKIDHIVAGPNITISPLANQNVLQDPALDIIIVPSQWVYDQYALEAPTIAHKLRIWPAGVTVPIMHQTEKKFDFLIYNKIGNQKLFSDIVNFLQQQNYRVTIFNYGSFNQADYFKALEQSKFEIYLSESESQGLAMAEAWVREVPTLVWERGFWQGQGISWHGLTASPYVNDENGARFKNFEEFKARLVEFTKTEFQPREFVERELSNQVSAQKYLQIYNSL